LGNKKYKLFVWLYLILDFVNTLGKAKGLSMDFFLRFNLRPDKAKAVTPRVNTIIAA
jgi:hypothetical protein